MQTRKELEEEQTTVNGMQTAPVSATADDDVMGAFGDEGNGSSRAEVDFARSGIEGIDRAIGQRAVSRQNLIDLFRRNQEVLEKRKRTDRSIALGQAAGELVGALAGSAISHGGRSIVPESQSKGAYERYLKAIEEGNADRTKLQSMLNRFDADTARLEARKAEAEGRYNTAVANYKARTERGRIYAEEKEKDRKARAEQNDRNRANARTVAGIRSSKSDKPKKDENRAKAQEWADMNGITNTKVVEQEKNGNKVGRTTTETGNLTDEQVALFARYDDIYNSLNDLGIRRKDGSPASKNDILIVMRVAREKGFGTDYEKIRKFAEAFLGSR